jgi:hypothetical protein
MKLRRVSLQRISSVTLGLAFGAAVCALATGWADAASIALGGGVAWANFHLIRLLVSLVVRPGFGPWAQAWGLLLLTLKLLLAIVLVAGVFYQFPVAPMSFAFGATMLLVAIVLDATLFGEPLALESDAHLP